MQFLGAKDTVTGSKTLFEFEDKKILVDCGMYQGLKELQKMNRNSLKIDPCELDAIFLTHGHLDHCGMLPFLAGQGYKKKIYCTKLTRDVATVILQDSAKIQANEVKENPSFEPLYDQHDVEQALALFEVCEFERTYQAHGISFRFSLAGHVLGASSLSLKVQDKDIVFSGDIGRADDLLHPAPVFPNSADYLILESTYGDRVHPDKDPLNDIEVQVKRILSTQGILFVPAFALARSQVVIYLLSQLFAKKPELKIPVYLDSPMAVEMTKLYEKNSKALKISEDDFTKALDIVKLIEFGNDVKKLARAKGPYILVSSSGMISGGRAIKHFDMLAKHEKNSILLTGYQGAGTIGRALLEHQEIKVLGHKVNLRAHVALMDSLSAHADSEQILQLLAAMKRLPKKIFLNHGEPDSMNSLKRKIQQNFAQIQVEISGDKEFFPLESESR